MTTVQHVALATPRGFVARASSPIAPWATSIAWADTEDEAVDLAIAELAACVSDEVVSRSLLRPRAPLAGETLAQYLSWHDLLGHGFAFAELVRAGSDRHREPPRRHWPNILATLAAAYLLRSWVREAGARGLEIAAAYRPKRGATSSRHKTFHALDLDLLPGDGRFQGAYLRLAARLWRTHGARLALGVGSYHPRGSAWTCRIHIDTGTAGPRPRCWQIHHDESIDPPAIETIASKEPS